MNNWGVDADVVIGFGNVQGMHKPNICHCFTGGSWVKVFYHKTKMLRIDDTGGSCGCRKHTITHVDTCWNHYYMDILLRTVSEMTLAKKTL